MLVTGKSSRLTLVAVARSWFAAGVGRTLEVVSSIWLTVKGRRLVMVSRNRGSIVAGGGCAVVSWIFCCVIAGTSGCVIVGSRGCVIVGSRGCVVRIVRFIVRRFGVGASIFRGVVDRNRNGVVGRSCGEIVSMNFTVIGCGGVVRRALFVVSNCGGVVVSR